MQIGAKRNIAHRNANGPVLETLLAAIRHDQLAAGAKQDALDTTTVAALRVLDHFFAHAGLVDAGPRHTITHHHVIKGSIHVGKGGALLFDDFATPQDIADLFPYPDHMKVVASAYIAPDIAGVALISFRASCIVVFDR